MPLPWFGPLVSLGFLGGFLASAILLRLGRLGRRTKWVAALALPFACAALPILILALASLASAALGGLAGTPHP